MRSAVTDLVGQFLTTPTTAKGLQLTNTHHKSVKPLYTHFLLGMGRKGGSLHTDVLITDGEESSAESSQADVHPIHGLLPTPPETDITDISQGELE
jgi:hypothetical protein